ncbi:mrp5 [Scenedesmus sp. PABB004]|nr:mrp5 [Scenedesmus sp. PABB004]
MALRGGAARLLGAAAAQQQLISGGAAAAAGATAAPSGLLARLASGAAASTSSAAWRSGAGGCGAAAAAAAPSDGGWRGYARGARPSDAPRGEWRRRGGPAGGASPGGGGGGGAAPWLELSALQLGRLPRNCAPTAGLRGAAPLGGDPFRDADERSLRPIQVDGSAGDDLEDPLLLRQQLEGSALPNEFKRSHFITPDWDELLVDVNRTVKVTKGGKVETLHALVVVGNGAGLLGVGTHSGKNVQKVMLDAELKAYQNLAPIPRYRGHTLFHPIDVTLRKVRLQAWPRPLGFGVTASPLVTALCDLAGVKNVTVKLSGNRKNARNVVQTFVEAFGGQSPPHDGVEGSGVYMREVLKRLPCGLRRGVDVP